MKFLLSWYQIYQNKIWARYEQERQTFFKFRAQWGSNNPFYIPGYGPDSYYSCYNPVFRVYFKRLLGFMRIFNSQEPPRPSHRELWIFCVSRLIYKCIWSLHFVSKGCKFVPKHTKFQTTHETSVCQISWETNILFSIILKTNHFFSLQVQNNLPIFPFFQKQFFFQNLLKPPPLQLLNGPSLIAYIW